MSWTERLKHTLSSSMDVMRIVREACDDIIKQHKGGQTKAFYEKMLSSHLYNKHVPCMTGVDCCTVHETTQVVVGQLDMEIAHNTLLELKAAAKIMPNDELQLRKYVQCRIESGMQVDNACVVCFRNDDTVEILNMKCCDTRVAWSIRSTMGAAEVIQCVTDACNDIISKYKGGQTEAFYETMLSSYLYSKNVPFLTQVDCFTTNGTTQARPTRVLVGRIDMEIAHNTLLELKATSKIMPGDELQLRKYVRSKLGSGMQIENACIVCFRLDGTVEILNMKC